MVKLSASHYSAVRSTAQSKLFKMLNIRMRITKVLKVLYRCQRLLLRPDWEVVEKLWLALLKIQLSEKLSIIKLMDSITDGINNEFQTIATRIEVSEKLALLGADMMVDSKELPENFLIVGTDHLAERNNFNEKKYFSIIHENSFHWRYHLLAGAMINDLMHLLTKYPAEVTKIFVNNLIHGVENY
ncbi:CLUMA_CG011548, isoform A [Clunio marinus]|uniref:CLUMA_CG011548, isoform A n=1 Tax=Clunio marinus TaxID=568069 RepID=A0A1J1ID22_9DIPT|nr:CLUMA_CG011548, isoform A [Clunio marinus]